MFLIVMLLYMRYKVKSNILKVIKKIIILEEDNEVDIKRDIISNKYALDKYQKRYMLKNRKSIR